MNKILHALIALSLTLSIATPLAQAGENEAAKTITPVGIWQTTSGESRYKISTCKNGKQICAKLVWLRSDVRTPENLKLLNKVVLSGAQRSQNNKWHGALKYAGETLNGSLTLLNPNRLRLNGCSFVFCKSVNFKRI